jgi:hypothetical protein
VLLLFKLMWLIVIVLVIRSLVRILFRLLKPRQSGGNAPDGSKRFDAQGEDIEDGEFKELK